MQSITDKNTDYQITIKSSTGFYRVLAFFFGALLALGYWFDIGFFKWTCYALGAIGSAALVNDWFFQHKNTLSLREGFLDISRGLFKNRQSVALSGIREALIIRQKEAEPVPFKNFDLDNAEQASSVKSLKINYQDEKTKEIKKIEFRKYEYEADNFLLFLKSLQEQFTEIHATADEKIETVQNRCLLYLQQDRQLIHDLTESLHDAYRSVYNSYLLQTEHPADKKRLESPDVVYYYVADPQFYYYYLKDDYKTDIDPENIEIAHNLIAAAKQNLEIAQTRLDYYQQIKSRLHHLRDRQQQRTHLKEVADRLGKLQQKNMRKGDEQRDVDFDAEVLVQLEQLTHSIHRAETLSQSEVLKAYAEVFSTQQSAEDQLLREINEKLGGKAPL